MAKLHNNKPLKTKGSAFNSMCNIKPQNVLKEP